MAAVKLVLILLLCVEILHVKGIRTNNEEEEPETLDAHIVYDQRQSGKYNIHVVIKDVAIIEMDQNEIADQNYNDDEYYYDEDDLTVKPLITKTTTTTNKPLDTTTTKKTTISATENESVVTTVSTTIPTTTIKNKIPNNEEHFNMYSLFPQPAVDTKSRSKIEPIYAIEEPTMLQPRHQLDNFNYKMPAQSRDESKLFKNSRIYKVKVRRSHHITPQTVRCRSFQYRDARGNCRSKRSSSGSILKRLFRMLVTLPFNQDEQQIDD
ncbi:uncharacterized protein LOC111685777 [Lucilia cuprina]|uniref:uncharacterized protein LOC111685777 n=1 Tax=Lucilia cuprina TaxID=7375 RepID=UPI001F05909F|nr:uncharacterized protein LOC111685777 [Lucilia cuprina]